jgi:hypothetical protein
MCARDYNAFRAAGILALNSRMGQARGVAPVPDRKRSPTASFAPMETGVVLPGCRAADRNGCR